MLNKPIRISDKEGSICDPVRLVLGRSLQFEALACERKERIAISRVAGVRTP